MDKLKISVVTVCYNAVDTLEETMLSVLNQTYTDIEYIIIDGGSTDGTVDIIKKYADRLAYWVSEPDKGIYDAMNKGILIATGDYINFMNAGDKFISKQIIEIIQFKGDVIYGDAIYRYRSFRLLFKPQKLDKFTYCFPIYHQATFVRKNLIQETMFDIQYKSSADYDLLRKLYFNNAIFIYSPVAICEFEAETGLSSTNILQQLTETGIINGQNNQKLYKLKIYYSMLNFKLKKMFMRVLPNTADYLRKRSLLKQRYIYKI